MLRLAVPVAGSLVLLTAAQNDDMNDDDDEPSRMTRLLLKKEELLERVLRGRKASLTEIVPEEGALDVV